MSWLQKGRVCARHPQDHSVDLVMYLDGSRLAGVQVLSGDASATTGTSGLPLPATPASGNIWDLSESTANDVIAIVGYMGKGLPVVLGFLFPQICSMTFADGRRVTMHESGAYSAMAEDGSIELYHPSGSFVRMGTGGHADMTGQDVDGNFKQETSASAPDFTIGVGSNGTSVANFHIDPAGNLTWVQNGTASLHVVGNTTLQLDGTLAATVDGNTTLTCPQTTIDGALIVNGLTTLNGGVVGKAGAGGGAAMTITGNVTVTSGEVSADGIGVKAHHHVAEGANANTSSAVA